MPITGARYRFKTLSSGKKVRLAFVGKKAVEATPFKKNKLGILKKSGASKKLGKVVKLAFNR